MDQHRPLLDMNLRFFTPACLCLATAGMAADVVTYQQGAAITLNGASLGVAYQQVSDVELRSAEPTANFNTGSGQNNFTLDGSDGGGSTQLAMRFDQLFGSGVGQIPTNAEIQSATLQLNITNEGNDFSIYRIASGVAWEPATATWNSFGPSANDGILLGTETAGSPVTGSGARGVCQVDITPIVTAWAQGAENNGMAFFPGGSNGADIDSSESASLANRPKLTIEYVLLNPNAPQFASNSLSRPDARATVAYSGTLTGEATDPDGDPLTYSKVNGPAWLAVDTNGGLSGAPGNADMGENTFLIQASDGEDGAALATLRITVNDANGNPLEGPSNTSRYRLVWVNDPATTMTLCWDQATGSDATVYYGPEDQGRAWSAYPLSKTVDRAIVYRGMNNLFARLSGLLPDTAYFFVLKDSAGTSERYWFKTAPATPQPFGYIAGGDSRNNRTPRQYANQLVAKLRPLFVAFTGDMISSDNDADWLEWMDDWQQSIADDGRMFPLLPHRGNHESGGNTTIYNLFDTTPGNYYGVNFGGDLLRYYVLNSESGESTQTTWLQGDLNAAGGANAFTHLVAGYHRPMRPHTTSKGEGSSQYSAWAELFYANRFDLIFESDSHVMKRTKPIRPSVGGGSEEGFIEDTANGAVYVGEGCWGAPLRSADDDKGWTAASGSFNGFDLVHVYEDRMEIFTVQVDGAPNVSTLGDADNLSLPQGITLWQPASGVRHIAGLRSGAPARSFAQWQLEQFGASIEASDTADADPDADGRSNLAEFAMNLDPHRPDLGDHGKSPLFEINNAARQLKYSRPSNSGLRYEYQASTNMQNWTTLEAGVDYLETASSDGATEDVTITMQGDFASQSPIFLRIKFVL